MRDLKQSKKRMIAVYYVWVFINIISLLSSSGNKYRFWPIDHGSMEDTYDIKEFLVYVVGPLLAFYVYEQFSEKK